MKKYLKIRLLIALFFSVAPSFSFAKDDVLKDQTWHFLVSYPRSGTNLMSCYIQGLTRKPIQFFTEFGTLLGLNRLNLDLDYTKITLHREHYGPRTFILNNGRNKLLLLVRNYKECIRRENLNIDFNSFRDIFVNNKSDIERYVNNILTFHNWDPSNRLLVYYEDLIADPYKEVLKALIFFGEDIPNDFSSDLLNNIRIRALESYHKQHGSHSKGTNLQYHSQQMPTEYLKEIDDHMETRYPILWDLYLKRYKSNLP